MVFHYVNFISETNTWWLRKIRPVRKIKQKQKTIQIQISQSSLMKQPNKYNK